MAAVKSPKLRAYQRTAIESARRALTKSGSCILQMPTGAGKTRAATEVIATSRGVIWFVCHRQEIERQAAKAFAAAGIKFGIVSPRGKPEYDKRVQIVSVGTLTRRIKELPEPRLVIWDECHHAPAKSWAKLRAKLKSARHLGLTATPERLDGKGLREWFAQLVTGPSIAGLIKKGFLSEFKYYAPSDPDLTAAKLQAGDYRKQDLGKIMNTPVLIGDAVREYKKHAKGKRALAFCASVEASLALAARFNKDGIKAAHVDGTTPAKDRDSAIEDLAAGRIKVLCNVEVFTEGFDLPAIDAVILMRPTKSPTLLLQMIGRGLRKAPGKDTAIIMDHAGLHRDHAWFADDWPWSLDGGAAKARRAAMTRGPRRCPECKEVRASREPVCDCGFEFPSGREIGEFDGVLTEVRGVVPEGCESRADFARRNGVAWETLTKWIARGMPYKDGFVPISEASVWVTENRDVARNARYVPPTDVDDQSEYESKTDFSKRIGRSCTVINSYIRRGAPIASNGWIHIKGFLDFMKRDSGSRLQPVGVKDADKYVNRKTFGQIVGVTPITLIRYCDDWLSPAVAPNGWIHLKKGMDLFKKNAKLTTPYKAGLSTDEFESTHAFSKRIGVAPQTAKKMIDRGIPSRMGFIHIQRGLEWVRNNTNIKIPASAWPKKAAKSKRNGPPDELRPGL